MQLRGAGCHPDREIARLPNLAEHADRYRALAERSALSRGVIGFRYCRGRIFGVPRCASIALEATGSKVSIVMCKYGCKYVCNYLLNVERHVLQVQHSRTLQQAPKENNHKLRRTNSMSSAKLRRKTTPSPGLNP